MNVSIKAPKLISSQISSCFYIKSAFFHSTPFLERGRRSAWSTRYNNNNSYNKRYRRNHFKEKLLRNADSYIDYLFQSWGSEFDRDEQPSKKGPSWFKGPNGSRRNKSFNQGHQTRGRKGFSFCEDDDEDVEAIFRSAFGDRFFFWSFVNEDYSNKRASSRHSNGHKSSWKWSQQSEDEYEYEYEGPPGNNTRKSELASERMALGLSPSGPIKLEEVKNAYRASALKWHPDRHQGSSKADAEEKFKHCTAAYQSLCDKLAVN